VMTPRLPSPPTAGAEGTFTATGTFTAGAEGTAVGRVGVAVSPLAAQASRTPADARGQAAGTGGQAAGTGGQAAGTAWNESHVRVVTVYDSPRVRLIYNFVSEDEASELISIAQKSFVRSGTARAGDSEHRTSESTSLPDSNPTVAALRARMGRFVGYPVQALEPLQEVRYRPGQYYKPHHDYYNGCETWIRGNRHFTYLVYLNELEGGGGQTGFPRLNLTIDPTFGAALLFDNVLPNGEPDERTLHEGVAPTSGVKYAINGWMRSKTFGTAVPFDSIDDP